MAEESAQPDTVTDEITLFGGSSAVFKDAILKFRDLIDINRYNKGVKIISDDTAANIEQCAVNFRYTCDQTATLVERLANGWMEDTKLFFEDPEGMTPEDAKAISEEALTFSRNFKVISTWVRGLAGKMHDYFKKIEQENGVAVEEAEKAFEKARADNEAADEARNRAAKQAEEAATSQFLWGVGAFIPIVNFVALPMYFNAQDKTKEAEKQKDDALCKAAISGKAKDDKKARFKEVEEMANKIEKLAECLTRVEGICEGQAKFWKEQSDKFGTFSSRLKGSKGALQKKATGLLKWLEERQVQLLTHYEELQDVAHVGFFTTKLQPSLASEGEEDLFSGCLALTSEPHRT